MSKDYISAVNSFLQQSASNTKVKNALNSRSPRSGQTCPQKSKSGCLLARFIRWSKVRARLNQQTLATLGGRQILKMSANAQFQLFSEILLSLEQSDCHHLHLGLVGSKPGLDVPVMRSKVTATPSEDRPTVNVALQLRKSGFTLKVHRAYRSDFRRISSILSSAIPTIHFWPRNYPY